MEAEFLALHKENMKEARAIIYKAKVLQRKRADYSPIPREYDNLYELEIERMARAYWKKDELYVSKLAALKRRRNDRKWWKSVERKKRRKRDKMLNGEKPRGKLLGKLGRLSGKRVIRRARRDSRNCHALALMSLHNWLGTLFQNIH